jgi:hypothetical protein
MGRAEQEEASSLAPGVGLEGWLGHAMGKRSSRLVMGRERRREVFLLTYSDLGSWKAI